MSDISSEKHKTGAYANAEFELLTDAV